MTPRTIDLPVIPQPGNADSPFRKARVKNGFAISPALDLAPDHPAQLTAALVHEIRNPLTNINLSIALLETSIIDPTLKSYLDIIMRSSIRIDHLINDFLITRQAAEILTEKHSIQQLLEEVLVMAGDRFRLKNIAVIKDYGSPDSSITLNGVEIKIALTNIIVNAIDAMTTGKGCLKLTTKPLDAKYTLQIEDNGCGISPENLKKIFKPFFTNKPGGLGIGLSTTYDILWSNHVEVAVSSVEGKGTCFSLLFDKYNSL